MPSLVDNVEAGGARVLGGVRGAACAVGGAELCAAALLPLSLGPVFTGVARAGKRLYDCRLGFTLPCCATVTHEEVSSLPLGLCMFGPRVSPSQMKWGTFKLLLRTQISEINEEVIEVCKEVQRLSCDRQMIPANPGTGAL